MTGCTVRGFTLLELLVATAIVLILAWGVLLLGLPADSGFRTQPAAIELQNRLRVAADALQADVLSAGGGAAIPIAGLPVGLVVPSVVPYRVGTRAADPPGTFRDDLLTTITALPAAAVSTIAGDFQGVSGSVTVDLGPGCPVGHPSCGLETGMAVLLVDVSGQSDLFGITSAAGNAIGLDARGRASGRRYAAGAWVVPVGISTYYLRPAGADGWLLARYDGHQSDLPQVDHLVALSFEHFGDPQPPQPRSATGPVSGMTYGPPPPMVGEDDPRDSWGPGENCVIAMDSGRQVPRLAVLGPASAPLRPLDRGSLTDGPWCPDVQATNRFDADLLRIRKVRATLRAEASSGTLRGIDPRLFRRPGTSVSAARQVPDQQVTFDVVLRAPGGTR